jgi:hypothetical protein
MVVIAVQRGCDVVNPWTEEKDRKATATTKENRAFIIIGFVVAMDLSDPPRMIAIRSKQRRIDRCVILRRVNSVLTVIATGIPRLGYRDWDTSHKPRTTAAMKGPTMTTVMTGSTLSPINGGRQSTGLV